MQRSRALAAFLTLFVAPRVPATAQNFNVDVGLPTSTPSASFGAAAAQPGPWTSVGFTPTVPVTLVSTTGAPTGVTLVCNGGDPITSTAAIPLTAQQNPDIVALMADLNVPLNLDVGTWTFNGLAPGDYAITTYAYASDFGSGVVARVDVPGSPDLPRYVGLTGWTSANLELGTTHAVHRIVVHPGTSVVVNVIGQSTGSVNGFQITQVAVGDPFCAGDGVDATVSSTCPCGNLGDFGHGCTSSVNPDGARLDARGTTSPDTLALLASGMPLTATSMFVQGDARADQVFGDGLGCVGGNIIRLATRANLFGTNVYPIDLIDVPLHVRGQVVPGSGTVRHYQAFYRNSVSFCTPATFNTTNARTLVW